MIPLLVIAASVMAQAAPITPVPLDRFYNRPGATIAQRDADLQRCRQIITAPMAETSRTLTPPIGDGADLPRPMPTPSDTIEQCMTMHGWNLYALSPREQARWLRLSPRAHRRLHIERTGSAAPAWGQSVKRGERLGPSGEVLQPR